MDAKTKFTYSDVAEHSTKKDLFVVIHDKVYDCTSFADEHPGGEEVLLDVGGKDATDAFEDVGHSDEAREILEKLIVGQLLRQPGDEEPVGHGSVSLSSQPEGKSLTVYLLLALVAMIGSAAYQYAHASQLL